MCLRTIERARAGWLLGGLAVGLAMARCWGGGSGLNVLVVVNQTSTNSVHLGNYYCEKRQVPPQNLLRINWPGDNVVWTNADFQNYLRDPLLAMLGSRGLTNQIDYVVLCMDIPYQTSQSGDPLVSGINSTTAALFYGFKSDYADPNYYPTSCNLPTASSNSYAGSERVFRSFPPGTAPTNSFLTMMLTSSNLALAEAIIDHGVASDGSFSQQPVILGKSSDPFRNVRYVCFDNAIFDARLRGNYSMFRTNSSSPFGLTNLLGYENGLYQFTIQPNTFAAGAMADSSTSYGGLIFAPNDHTVLLSFLDAGASGSYGTVVEPCNYLEKFPSPEAYFYQSRGFSLAECYYLSITNPYQGLLVGEPLAAPFARQAGGAWTGLPRGSRLSGTTNLLLQIAASDAAHPVQQVDLFVDGVFAQTLTNVPPFAGNRLEVSLRGRAINYEVPADASLSSIATELSDLLNASSNSTSVTALAHGDRMELQSLDIGQAGSQVSLAVSNLPGTAAVQTVFLTASGSSFLDTMANGIQPFSVSNAPTAGSYLQLTVTKTNGVQVTVALTNTAPDGTVSAMTQGLLDMVNTNSELQGADGIVAEDFVGYDVYFGLPYAEFNLRARSAGWAGAEVQVTFSGSTDFILQPAATGKLEHNLTDLRPRAHLYLCAGVTNVALGFPLDTTTLADGYHQLTAVVYEGTHVRTQTRLNQDILVQNGTLAASLETLVGGTNCAVEGTLEFSVTANTNAISTIELFSTGGSLNSVANQQTALFTVPAEFLGIGLHPFFGLVTDADGHQYRTDTKWIRIVGQDSPMPLVLAGPPPVVHWSAAAGRSYDILSTTNLTTAFQIAAVLTPTNNLGQWADTNVPAAQRFYRVRTSY